MDKPHRTLTNLIQRHVGQEDRRLKKIGVKGISKDKLYLFDCVVKYINRLYTPYVYGVEVVIPLGDPCMTKSLAINVKIGLKTNVYSKNGQGPVSSG